MRLIARYRDMDFESKLGQSAVVSLAINLSYAAYNAYLGATGGSIWLKAMCIYYAVMAVMRLMAMRGKGKTAARTGWLLILLSVVLIGVQYISFTQDVAVKYSTIPMITIATFTFYKIGMAVVRGVRAKKLSKLQLWTLCSITYAEVAVSVVTMQRSMLVSFDGMSVENIMLMNALTGAAACLFIFVMGIILINSERKRKNG